MTQASNGGGAAPAPPSKGMIGGGVSGAAAGGGPAAGAAESGDAFGHHDIRDIKRGQGQSAVKSAAYITGDSIFDARLGLTFGRPEKQGRVLAIGTVGPKGSTWTAEDLWGGAEKAESKSNARTAQERVLALPHELDEAGHKRLLNGYSLWLRDEYGVAATWALHAPNQRGDQRNTHGHILTTTRTVGMDAEGRPEFGPKVRALSGRRDQVAAEFEKQRAEWAKRVNAELERVKSPRRLDHRSHARRAEAGEGPAEMEPGAHKGARRAAKERRDPAARKAARAAEAARRERNAARDAAWRQGERAAQSVIRAGAEAARDQGPDEREAAKAAQWAAKKAREWEEWRQQQEEDAEEHRRTDKSR